MRIDEFKDEFNMDAQDVAAIFKLDGLQLEGLARIVNIIRNAAYEDGYSDGYSDGYYDGEMTADESL